MLLELNPEPIGLEAPGLKAPAPVAPLDRQPVGGKANALADALGAEVVAEAEVEQQPLGTAEAEDRPGTEHDEAGAEGETYGAGDRHQDGEAPGRQAAVRRQDGVEQDFIPGRVAHGQKYRPRRF